MALACFSSMFSSVQRIDNIRSKREADDLAETYRQLALECERKSKQFERRELIDYERRAAFKKMFRDIRITLTKDLFATTCHTGGYSPNYPNYECVQTNFKRIQRNWQAEAMAKRNNRIITLHDRGLSDGRIGDIYNLSKQRIQQIRTQKMIDNGQY